MRDSKLEFYTYNRVANGEGGYDAVKDKITKVKGSADPYSNGYKLGMWGIEPSTKCYQITTTKPLKVDFDSTWYITIKGVEYNVLKCETFEGLAGGSDILVGNSKNGIVMNGAAQ